MTSFCGKHMYHSVLLLAIAGFCFSLTAYGATVPVAPGAGALSAAFAAANVDDVLELSTGNYDEDILVLAGGKNITIQAGAGQDPIVRFTSTTFSPATITFDIQIQLLWKGVDILLDSNDPNAPQTIRGIVVRAAGSNATFEDCTIMDGPNFGVTGTWFFVSETNATFNNVTLDIDNNPGTAPAGKYQIGIGAFGDNARVTLNNCNVSVRSWENGFYAQSAASGSDAAKITMNDCTIDPEGGPFLMTSANTGDYELNNCNVIMDDGATIRGVLMRLVGNTGTFRANRCIFDRSAATSAGSNGSQMFAADADNPLVELTNCVVKFQGALAPSSAFAFQFGGDLTLRHCTIVDVNPIPIGNVGMYFNDLGSLGRTGTLEVRNCIFDLGTGTPAAYIFDEADRGADNGSITYTIGKNLINGTVANTQVEQGGFDDRIGDGTVVEADPMLAADKIHLSSMSSPAVDAGVDIGVTVDFDGEARPQGAGPDIGADEAGASSVDTWMVY